MKTSIQIGKIMDIPIKLHITFLLILPVFAWIFANNDPRFGFNDVGLTTFRYALSLFASISLFVCVLLHELGHSYVAKKAGVNIQGITLFLFGGVSSMEEIPRNPRTELKMALAGPLVSLVIGFILIIGVLMVNGAAVDEFLTAFIQNLMIGIKDPYIRLFWVIGIINVILFFFNILPAFPMDGGRVLRAWLAGRMPYIQATRTAASIGKMFAIVMGIFGIFVSIWLLLIAFFIYIGASEEEKSTEVSVILEGLKIKDIMTRDVATVRSGNTVEELVDIMFRMKHMGYPVMDDSEVIGVVTFTDVQRVPKEERKNVKVSQIMTKELITTKEDDEAVAALKLMTTKNIGRIIVKKEGKMTGIVSRTDILRAIQLLE
ncbi:MAG TPA: CBS domain-containing protein [Candidatus Methanoperedens sp.]|nr:CBS domain-containing protein [Candidatus Methanoperedens sp.]HLB71435.1 CBS domain-containing protein [Candidatus Methanoperedens sp.]